MFCRCLVARAENLVPTAVVSHHIASLPTPKRLVFTYNQSCLKSAFMSLYFRWSFVQCVKCQSYYISFELYLIKYTALSIKTYKIVN